MEIFQIFGEGRRGLHAIIAMCAGFIVLFSTGVVSFIQTFTPWFTMVILVIFFILFAVRMFGVKAEEITQGFFNNPSILTWIIIFTVVIILFSLGSGFGQQSLNSGQGTGNVSQVTATGPPIATPGSTNTTNYNQNLYNTIFHPKVLGMLLIFLIVVIGMLLLTSKEGP